MRESLRDWNKAKNLSFFAKFSVTVGAGSRTLCTTDLDVNFKRCVGCQYVASYEDGVYRTYTVHMLQVVNERS